MSSSTSSQATPTIPTRYITTHDPETGKAVLDKTVDTQVQPITAFPGLFLYNIFSTASHPASLANNADIQSYLTDTLKFADLETLKGIQYQIVELHPASPDIPPVMHRTVSLDVGVLLDGEVELGLDSGEKRNLKRGDIVVQRGTAHAWRNLSETENARIFFVLSPIEKLVVKGEVLGFEHPGLSHNEMGENK